MSTRRFHLPPPLPEEGAVELPAEEAHHARTVLRLREGDTLTLFDGAGRVAEARLQRLSKREVTAEILHCRTVEPPALRIAIAFAPPKGKRASAAVEALTELGADELIPLRTERAEAEGGAPDRWESRAVEAAKQCARAWLPVISPPAAIPELLARPDELRLLASLAPQALCGAEELAGLLRNARRVLWCIGPEGGFTAEEEEELRSGGAVPIRLSENVLRIATAAELACGLTRFHAHPPRGEE